MALLVLTTACGQERATASCDGRAVGNAAPAQQAADGAYGSDGGDGSDAAAGGAREEAGQLAVWDSRKLGKVLTGSEGFTLYRFDKDTSEPPTSNCDGECAKAWPAVPAQGAEAPAGADGSLIGEVTRSDGTKQLTVGGAPMYRYAEYSGPGDANGRGVGGTWSTPAGAEGPTGGRQTALAGISVRKDPELGDSVVDGRGMTVYRFQKDSACR
ncbi:putative lipoprotein with Yx(FWY)xxD motif [Streptomyces sp. HB132]|nr:putative lipoprotein with Yx(FWY)xxD motif [Streptomyces sp. HB132]